MDAGRDGEGGLGRVGRVEAVVQDCLGRGTADFYFY